MEIKFGTIDYVGELSPRAKLMLKNFHFKTKCQSGQIIHLKQQISLCQDSR